MQKTDTTFLSYKQIREAGACPRPVPALSPIWPDLSPTWPGATSANLFVPDLTISSID